MSLRIENTLIADGRRLATRAIVLQSLSSVPCYAFRRVIAPVEYSHFDDRLDETWGGLGVASDMDEHAFDYEPLGFAMLVLEQFSGSAVHDLGASVGFDEIVVMGQVESYDIALKGRERLHTMPDWTPQKGDLFCLLVAENDFVYLECVGKTGSSLMGDFGAKYLFNQKFDLDFIDNLDKDFLADRNAIDWE